MAVAMLDSDIIQHINNSSFASLMMLVKNEDNSWRLCVDYLDLNKLTIKDKFFIPLVEELFEELVRATIFSKLDIRLGYHHQIKMASIDVFKIVFRTHNGHYEFLVMSFGFTNALATF